MLIDVLIDEASTLSLVDMTMYSLYSSSRSGMSNPVSRQLSTEFLLLDGRPLH